MATRSAKRAAHGIALIAGFWIAAGSTARNITPPGAIVARAAAALENLQSVDELKAVFNRDSGKTRLVLLLSPT
jgi:hypothetical protein